MRKYREKDNVQKKSYYNDRFFVSPAVPRQNTFDDEIYSKDIEYLSGKIEVLEHYVENKELVLYIKVEDNIKTLEILKDNLEYDMLMELSAIDYISTKNGFEIFYELLSMSKHKRLRVKTFIQKDEPVLSVISLFKMASWSEREMYDMYGITILNHPFMKRILMPDDWYDYPLLKTYPLQGDETASWYEVDKIFGKEARNEIGPEIRDSGAIDRCDTTRFARLGHEVSLGVDITNEEEPEYTPLAYQEEGGVKFVKEFHEDKSVTLKKRR